MRSRSGKRQRHNVVKKFENQQPIGFDTAILKTNVVTGKFVQSVLQMKSIAFCKFVDDVPKFLRLYRVFE